ncbi:WS/DGAT/MGAT family acyltransferase [Pelomonas saccharophila]|uniref:diacylglycerol O-acyltransferase n=1 Tax=Roseateles saccharophilus TaxID=304 RepID=A0ABU1YV04_ROSSA|nr:wax ester/triacylglycerol synthase domain-containing protein [Roseateles saccharophilus]MDR7272687.1 WS/DGAT/MGAT family acyltransferase [Roseateles saccharophilus]
MSRLSLLDLAFFIAESEASPKHVAGLHIHQIPKGGGANFAKQLYEEFLTHTDVQPPFDAVINFVSPTLMPSWGQAESVDLTQHVFFHKMKAGHNDREALYALVSELHEPVLDRSRPLWEVHVIAGLWDKQFAIYYKMHHAVADGITMTRWGVESLRTTPEDDTVTPVWTFDHTRRSGGLKGKKRLDQAVAGTVWKQLTANSKRAIGIGRLTAMLALEAVKLTKNAIALPFMASGNTPFTGNATPGRQFATAAVPMARIDAIRKVSRATLNHVALTCLDGAMHRYLADEGIELDRPITIQMPVNLRREGEKSGGNKIGIILVDLSPPTDDAYVRLRNVGYSLRNVRSMIDAVAPEAVETYTILTGLLGQIAGMLKLADMVTPMGNTLVSNVPGPAERLYLKGAPLLEMHPVSTLPATHLLNITLFSYAGTLYFGLIATDALPNLGRLSAYIEEEIATLEEAVGI